MKYATFTGKKPNMIGFRPKKTSLVWVPRVALIREDKPRLQVDEQTLKKEI